MVAVRKYTVRVVGARGAWTIVRRCLDLFTARAYARVQARERRTAVFTPNGSILEEVTEN
jgi:hypothetical protein